MTDRELIRRYRNYDTNELRLRLARKREEARRGYNTRYEKAKAEREIQELIKVVRARMGGS